MSRFFTIIATTTLLLSFGPAVSFTRSTASFFKHTPRGQTSLHVGCGDTAPAPTPTKCQENIEALTDSSASLWGVSPYLAVLTEPDACGSIERVEETIHAIDKATMDGGVDLVVLRVSDDGPGNESALLKWALLKNLAELKQRRHFLLVVNNDVEIVIQALSQNITVDGVHVKEYKTNLIPSIRSKLEHASTCAFNKNDDNLRKNLIIGTSCHSLDSAMRSYQLSPRGPDYLFVGTCFLTQSHPEKDSVDQLEGPKLPGRVRRELHQMYDNKEGTSINAEATINPRSTAALSPPPIIIAIGGIDEKNCHEPVVKFGADGVATIRTVMQSSDPRDAVHRIKRAMQSRENHADE